MAGSNSAFLWVAVAAGVALLLLSQNSDASPVPDSGGDYLSNFPGLAGNFVVGGDSANRLNGLIGEMVARGYSSQQIEYMLSQILFETGMLTSVANTRLMNQYNFAGLTTTSGGYAAYSGYSDFMDAYVGFLTKGSNPLGATSLTDFNNRLIANHYYTENPDVYLSGLQAYYNALTS